MTVLFVIHLLMCLGLIAVILIQPGKSDMGINFGSSSQSIFGSKGAGNFLTKTTAICAAIFLVSSFLLTKTRLMSTEKSVVKPTIESNTSTSETATSSEAKTSEATEAEKASESRGLKTAPQKEESSQE